ncbi:MAG: hypothetical protein FWE06_02725 [Oscillospiraceae bacterium]|nr:hypothetical protein [Oscillospiraceae bacterium]
MDEKNVKHDTSETNESTIKVKNPKRNLRFLAIYILLLFSVSTIFLVTSLFATHNISTDRLLFEAGEDIAMLEQERDTLLNELSAMDARYAALREERNALRMERESLQDDIERLEGEIEAFRTVNENYMSELRQLRQRVTELESLLASEGEE